VYYKYAEQKYLGIGAILNVTPSLSKLMHLKAIKKFTHTHTHSLTHNTHTDTHTTHTHTHTQHTHTDTHTYTLTLTPHPHLHTNRRGAYWCNKYRSKSTTARTRFYAPGVIECTKAYSNQAGREISQAYR
jgi:hypothetical protein